MECLALQWITAPKKVWERKLQWDRSGSEPVWTGQKRYDSIQVPCGKCAFCLQNKRSEWMFRIFHEMRVQEHPGYFLTMTYDEKHVRRADNGQLSLRFYDIQLYIKRLRKAKYYAKYICVGEYGTETHRPHYHMLLWTNAPIRFLETNWKSSRDGSPMGSIHFGTLNVSSAMYTLKYIIQPKQRAIDGIEKTRAQFSKGLGLGYLTTDVYYWHTEDFDNPKYYSFIDQRRVALPRYYRNKIFTKWQNQVNRLARKEEQEKELQEELKRMAAQGVADPKAKRIELRLETAQRIIKKTKYSLSL